MKTLIISLLFINGTGDVFNIYNYRNALECYAAGNEIVEAFSSYKELVRVDYTCKPAKIET